MYNTISLKIIISLFASLALHGIILMPYTNNDTPFTSPPSNLSINFNYSSLNNVQSKNTTLSNTKSEKPVNKKHYTKELTKEKKPIASHKEKDLSITNKTIETKSHVAFIPKNEFKEKTLNNNLSTASNLHIKENYISNLRSKISSQLYYPLRARRMRLQGNLKVQFVIFNNGKIEQISIQHSSGRDLLDKAAQKTVHRIGMYKPFPDEITEEFLSVVVPMKYQLN